MITIKEIAEKLDVSTTTVSNVIHGKTKEVSSANIERIQKALKEYHYVPNLNARNLAGNRTRIIGVIIKNYHKSVQNRLKDPFINELLGGIEKETGKNGYFLMIYMSDDIQEVKNFIMSWNVAGMILVGFVEGELPLIQEECECPIVNIDNYTGEQIERCIDIGLDDRKAMYEMVRYLIDCGHRKIAFLADNEKIVESRRFFGYDLAMKEAGLEGGKENFIRIIRGKADRIETMMENYEEIYEKSFQYTAFACTSDLYAVLILNALKDRGRRIPEDISITGFDDNDMARIVRPALTTVHQSVEKRGKKAVELLISMIKDPKESGKKAVFSSTELVIRDSVKKINN